MRKKLWITIIGAALLLGFAVSVLAGTALILLLLATAAMNRALRAKRRVREQTAVAVAELEMRLCELQEQSREISLLADMSAMLHLSSGSGEAIEIVPVFGERLFPLSDGAVYLLGPSTERAELAACWGKPPAAATVGAHDCAALRPTFTQDSGTAQHTHHTPADPGDCSCLPLVAFGDPVGVLSLHAKRGMNPRVERLTRAFADQLSLAVASLRMRETLKAHAVQDPLTGLFNRRHFSEVLSREMLRCQLEASSLSVILIDIDRFKNFNDVFGHAAGDVVLQQFAAAMRQSVRDGDVVCRYGGEEFAILLPETPLDLALDCADRLRQRVRALDPRLGGRSLGTVTISAGVATGPDHASDGDHLLDAADRALYRAKNSGRDRVMTATTGIEGWNAA